MRSSNQKIFVKGCHPCFPMNCLIYLFFLSIFFLSQKTDLGFLGLAVWLAESSNIETKKNVKIMLQNQYATKIEQKVEGRNFCKTSILPKWWNIKKCATCVQLFQNFSKMFFSVRKMFYNNISCISYPWKSVCHFQVRHVEVKKFFKVRAKPACFFKKISFFKIFKMKW